MEKTCKMCQKVKNEKAFHTAVTWFCKFCTSEKVREKKESLKKVVKKRKSKQKISLIKG